MGAHEQHQQQPAGAGAGAQPLSVHAPPSAAAPPGAGSNGGFVAATAATAAAPAAPAALWTLPPTLPRPPDAPVCGPWLRLGDCDSSRWNASVLVAVAEARLPSPNGSSGSSGSGSSGALQLHFTIDGGASYALAPATRLDAWLGWTFVRFDVSVGLVDQPQRLTYLVGLAGAPAPLARHDVQLPGRHEPWRWVAHSCNGFHERGAAAKYAHVGGIQPLWRDLLQRHAAVGGFHAQVGGGDQVYADAVLELPSLQPWLRVDDPKARAALPFTPAMLAEAEAFYLALYLSHFSDGAYGQATAQIPYVFAWDDHDIFDGWGSYDAELQGCPVFGGLFAVARRAYLLFQQHCTFANAGQLGGLLGTEQLSYHQVRSLGPNAVLLAPDTRSERTTRQVLRPASWQLLLAEADRRLREAQGRVAHLVVLLGIPAVYPRVPLTERVVAGVSAGAARSQALRRALAAVAGGAPGALNQWGSVDLEDDLRDHWTAEDHLAERAYLIRQLQALAAAHSARVSFLSGDVHCGAFGCLQAHPKLPQRLVDPKFMLQVVSSAIGNEPPPPAVLQSLEAASMASTALGDTLEKMIRAFPGGVKLKGQRNYVEVATLPGGAACATTGAPEPPGGLMFTLRFEIAVPPPVPGAPAPAQPAAAAGIEAFTLHAPVLLAGPRAAEAAAWAAAAQPFLQRHAAHGGGGGGSSSKLLGAVDAVGALLPGSAGQELKAGAKKLGHALGALLHKV